MHSDQSDFSKLSIIMSLQNLFFFFHFLWLDLYLDLERKLPNEEDTSANFNNIEIQSM